jgi:hypothetical protein
MWTGRQHGGYDLGQTYRGMKTLPNELNNWIKDYLPMDRIENKIPVPVVPLDQYFNSSIHTGDQIVDNVSDDDIDKIVNRCVPVGLDWIWKKVPKENGKFMLVVRIPLSYWDELYWDKDWEKMSRHEKEWHNRKVEEHEESSKEKIENMMKKCGYQMGDLNTMERKYRLTVMHERLSREESVDRDRNDDSDWASDDTDSDRITDDEDEEYEDE